MGRARQFMGDVTVGLDIGQKVDPTAIAIVETIEERTGGVTHSARWHRLHGPPGWGPCAPAPECMEEMMDVFIARDLGRLPLGTPYPAVADHVVRAIRRLNERNVYPRLVADATGVGTPVVDLLREATNDLDVVITEATFTAGETFDNRWRSRISVPKAHLVSRLQVLLQMHRIRLPRSKEAKRLAKELADYEIRINENANLLAGAFRVGAHDDLVTALGLAVLVDSAARQAFVGPSPYA